MSSCDSSGSRSGETVPTSATAAARAAAVLVVGGGRRALRSTNGCCRRARSPPRRPTSDYSKSFICAWERSDSPDRQRSMLRMRDSGAPAAERARQVDAEAVHRELGMRASATPAAQGISLKRASVELWRSTHLHPSTNKGVRGTATPEGAVETPFEECELAGGADREGGAARVERQHDQRCAPSRAELAASLLVATKRRA